MKWLLTGATGLLGANAAHVLDRTDKIVTTSRSAPAVQLDFLPADLADATTLDRLVDRSGADVVLHAGALSTHEACAADPDLATRVNVEASWLLAEQAARAGKGFVHISTDAVFDGIVGNYDETSEPSPQSVYGQTKLAAERAVLDAHPGALVARVNFYGWSPNGHRSLAEFFHRALRMGQPVSGFTDVRVSTLHVGLLIEALRGLVQAGANGVVHVASSEPVTKYDFGRRLATELGYNPELVRPALAADVLDLPRGSHLELNCARAEALLGAPMPDQAAGLRRLQQELSNGLPGAMRAFIPQQRAARAAEHAR